MVGRYSSGQFGGSLPLDSLSIPPLQIGGNSLAEFNMLRGQYVRRAEKATKPASCCLCGKQKTSYCNSHSVPEFCLRSIAENGYVLSTAVSIGTNLREERIGVKKAGTFRFICDDCDNHYFKGYETPSSFDTIPNQRLMGQIALKTCLFEMSKALKDQVLHAEIGADLGSARMDKKSAIRGVDARDDQRNLNLSRCAAEYGARSYKLIHYRLLDHTVPVAFQTMINPIVDLEGKLVNDLFNDSPHYVIEPLYACLFPMKGKSAVLLFRNRRTDRYDRFDKQFADLTLAEKEMAILKLVLAYCEEVYFSPAIEGVLVSDEGLSEITRMNIDSLALFGVLDTGKGPYSLVCEAAGAIYSLDSLPTVPNLLGPEFALKENRA